MTVPGTSEMRFAKSRVHSSGRLDAGREDSDRAEAGIRLRVTVAALLLGVVALWVLSAVPASAHAVLEGATPGIGSVVPTAPAALELTFSEPVRLPPESVQVFDSAGTPVAVTTRAVDTTVSTTFAAPPADGSYVVNWRVVSADGHPINGTYSFAIGAVTTTTATPPPVPEPSPALVLVLRVTTALADAALLLAVGLGVFARFLLPARAPATRARLTLIQFVAAVVAVVGALALLPLNALWADAGSVADLARAETWRGLIDVSTLLAPVLVAVGLALVVEGAARAWAVLAGGVLALGSLALNGHTRAYGPAWLSYPLDLLHVAAGAIWLGALVGIATALRRGTDVPAADGIAAVRRFSTLAMETIAVLAAAGIILASLILGSVADLVESAWGVTLLVKVGVVGVVLLGAALNRWRWLPAVLGTATREGEAAGLARLRRTVRIEAVGLAAVLAVTGVLVTQSPLAATTSGADVPAAAPAVERTGPLGADGGRVAFTLSPGTRGLNTLTITLTGPDGQPFTPPSLPKLAVSLPATGLGPLTQEVSETAPGTYRSLVQFDYAGTWTLDYRVRLDAYALARPLYPVTIR